MRNNEKSPGQLLAESLLARISGDTELADKLSNEFNHAAASGLSGGSRCTCNGVTYKNGVEIKHGN